MKYLKWRPVVSAVVVAGLFSFTIIANINHHSSDPLLPEKVAVNANALTYGVDLQKSTVSWTAKKYTGNHSGNVTLSAGSLQVDKKVLTGGTFTIDTRSITNTDLRDTESNTKLINHLKSDDFFSVEKFPDATLVITSVKPAANNQYDVQGNLTIKGKTNPVKFPATVTINDKQVSAVAKITVDRSKYDIKFRSQSFFENLGDKVIYDDFDLDVNLVAGAK